MKLVNFEEFFWVQENSPIVLELEDYSYCTVMPIHLTNGTISAEAGRIHYCEFDALQVIVGDRPYENEDRIKELHFRLSDTNSILLAPDIMNQIAQSTISDDVNFTIFETNLDDALICISYGATISLPIQTHTVGEPHGCIKFNNSKTIEEIHGFLETLHTFFTMAAGIPVLTLNHSITLDQNGHEPATGVETIPEHFQLIWPRKIPLEQKIGTLKPAGILRCWENEDRDLMSNCLKKWFELQKDWAKAFQGLFMATYEFSNFDHNRIVNACKWLEATPRFKKLENEKIDKNKLKAIRCAAIQKAKELDINDQSIKLLESAINNVKTKTQKERLESLVGATNITDEQRQERLVKDVKEAFYIRGSFAHDTFSFKSSEDFSKYVQCVQATEALAFLLLLNELPIPENYEIIKSPNHFTGYLST